MWNKVFADHQKASPNCKKGFLSWDMQAEQKFGLGWRERATCDKCSFTSEMFNLFEEENRDTPGRRPATINKALHVGLSQISIGPSSFSKLLCSINTPPPSAAGMQKSANSTMEVVQEENKNDMRLRCQDLRSINTLKGKNPATVNVQSDGCYNNALYSGVGKTPFQPSTQAIYLVAENETPRHQLLNVQNKTKLCSKRRQGSSIDCQHEGRCFANIDMATNIGNEEEWAKQSFLDLADAGLEVEYLTTDPDSSAYRAAFQLYEDGITSTEPKHLLDTRHVSQNQRKFIKNLSELTNHMPGKNKSDRQKMQNKFSIDLAERCQAEFTQAFDKFSRDSSKLKSALSYTCDAIVSCYHGNHDLCSLYSFVCLGKSNITWLQRSPFVDSDFCVKPCDESFRLIRKCVDYRLGQDMLEKTKMNTNTQKCEGSNRSMRRSLPKNVTFSRNFSGRSHSAAHSINHGSGESIYKLCRAVGSPIQAGTRVCRALYQLQKVNERHKQRKKSKHYKEARSKKRRALYKLYEQQQEQVKYVKNMLLPVQAEKFRRDHNYTKNDKPKRVKVKK